MVPKENRDAIWDAYCNGTRDDSLEAIRDAMIIVAETEGVEL